MQVLHKAWVSRWSTWCVLTLLHVGLAIFFLSDRTPGTDAARTGFPLDDAWIHMVYARSIAQTGLPCYNDGQPETGFTSPLWALLCAAAYGAATLLRVDVVLAVKVVGVLCALAGSIAVCELTRIYTRSAVAALIAGALCALTPAIAFTQVAGMEPCLAAATGLWALYALERRRYLFAGLFLAATAWTRPEMVLLVGLVVIGLLMVWRTSVLRQRRGDVLRVLGPVVVAMLVWCGYCYLVSGWLLPNTYYAKFHKSVGADILTVLREQLWTLPVNWCAAGLILYVIGFYALLRHASLTRVIVVIMPWLLFGAIVGSRRMPEGTGQYYYWLRYVVPGFPFLFVVLGAGWQWLWDQHKPSAPEAGRARDFVGIGRRVLAVALLMAALVGYPPALRDERTLYAWNCQNLNEVQVALGNWVAKQTPPDAAVAVNDAGAIRYFGQRRTIDLVGLNEHRLVHDLNKAIDLRRSAGALRDYLREYGANYLIVFPSWFPGLTYDPLGERLFRPVHSLRSWHYTVSPGEQEMMVVYAAQ